MMLKKFILSVIIVAFMFMLVKPIYIHAANPTRYYSLYINEHRVELKSSILQFKNQIYISKQDMLLINKAYPPILSWTDQSENILGVSYFKLEPFLKYGKIPYTISNNSIYIGKPIYIPNFNLNGIHFGMDSKDVKKHMHGKFHGEQRIGSFKYLYYTTDISNYNNVRVKLSFHNNIYIKAVYALDVSNQLTTESLLRKYNSLKNTLNTLYPSPLNEKDIFEYPDIPKEYKSDPLSAFSGNFIYYQSAWMYQNTKILLKLDNSNFSAGLRLIYLDDNAKTVLYASSKNISRRGLK